MRIRPSSVTGCSACFCQAKVLASRAGWIIVLEGRPLFLAAGLYPAQSLESRKVGDKRVVTATLSFVGHTVHVSVSKSLNVVGIDWPIVTLSFFLLHSRSSVHRSCFSESHFIVIKDISLGSADVRIYLWRTIGRMAQEKLPDKPATTKRAKKAAPARSEIHLPSPLCSIACRTNPSALRRRPFCIWP